MNPKTKRWITLLSTAAAAGLLYLIRETLLPFIFSGLFVYLLAPLVDFLVKQKFFGRYLSRGFTVMLVYVYVFLFVAVLGVIVLPPLYQEVVRIGRDLPHQLEHFRVVTLPALVQQAEYFNLKFQLHLDVKTYLDQGLETVFAAGKGQIESLATHMQTLLKLLFSALSTFLVIFIVTAFVLIDLPRIKVQLTQFIPRSHRVLVLELVQAIDRDLSGTIRGQLMICLINGTLTTLGLLLLNVKFAITIGFIAGLFSLIPVLGAIMSSIPAVLIALTQSWWTALAVVGVIIIIHLIEANFLNPKILGHTVDLHPAVIIFSIVVGEHFFGPVGLLFGVPVAAILRSILRYIYIVYLEEEPDTQTSSEIQTNPNLMVESEPQI